MNTGGAGTPHQPATPPPTHLYVKAAREALTWAGQSREEQIAHAEIARTAREHAREARMIRQAREEHAREAQERHHQAVADSAAAADTAANSAIRAADARADAAQTVSVATAVVGSEATLAYLMGMEIAAELRE
jgi:membrane protein involved in colicin uptake